MVGDEEEEDRTGSVGSPTLGPLAPDHTLPNVRVSSLPERGDEALRSRSRYVRVFGVGSTPSRSQVRDHPSPVRLRDFT